ncbi:MAG TPA: hypothetical protein VGJ28_00165 [Micromonosporaceae bacterium]|jgi:hypothetical protein
MDGQQDVIVAGDDSARRVGAGWWRRNRWGLIGLIPALVLALAVPVHDEYKSFWDSQPRAAIAVSKGDWASYHGGNLRLDTFKQATGSLPHGIAVWGATIDFRATSASALLNCEIQMQDSSGSTYDADPAELIDLGADIGVASCSPDTLGATTWHTTVYFMAPRGTKPTAVRVQVSAALPEYVSLRL